MRLPRSCDLCGSTRAWVWLNWLSIQVCSAAMLSKLENARLVPTLPTLVRIATVFNVGLDYFFTDPRKRHVVAISRKDERIKFPADAKPRDAAYDFESLNFRATERKLNAFLAHFHDLSPAKIAPHYHAGVEFLSSSMGSLRYPLEPRSTGYLREMPSTLIPFKNMRIAVAARDTAPLLWSPLALNQICVHPIASRIHNRRMVVAGSHRRTRTTWPQAQAQ